MFPLKTSLWQSFRIVFCLMCEHVCLRRRSAALGAHHSCFPCSSSSCFPDVLCCCALCMPRCSVTYSHLFMRCSHLLSCVVWKGCDRFLLPLHSDSSLHRGALGFKLLLALNSVWSEVCEPLGPSTSPLFSHLLSKHNDSSEPPPPLATKA